jgi:hypothetical protein
LQQSPLARTRMQRGRMERRGCAIARRSVPLAFSLALLGTD